MKDQTVAVERCGGGHRLAGSWSGIEAAKAFLRHLGARAFSPATVRAYAFDLVNFARFLGDRGIDLAGVVPTDIFDGIDWQAVRRPGREKVVAITAGHGSAPASVNRRVAAVRGPRHLTPPPLAGSSSAPSARRADG